MSEKSRNEKIALAKRRLQKFRDQKDGGGVGGGSGSGGSSSKSKQRKPNSAAVDEAEATAAIAASFPPHEAAAGQSSSSSPPPPPPEPSGNGDTAAKRPPPQSMAETAPPSNGNHARTQPQPPPPPPTPPPQEVESPPGSPSAASSVSGATESLMQLSQQINGFVSWDSPDQQSQQRAQLQQSLERRNVELASLLESRTGALDQAKRAHAQLREQLHRLQSGAAAELGAADERHRRELTAAREQQTGQAQTIGLLVAEKTELAAQLAHAQRLCQQRLAELSDAQERLRAARGRLAEAEKAASASANSAAQLQSGGREAAKEAERLRAELERTTAAGAESERTAAELKARLAARSVAAQAAEDQVRDLRRQLELAGVQLHQMGASRDRENRAAAAELGAANAELTERLARLSGERDRLAEQYREYTGRLGAEGKQLRAQVSALGTERSQLVNRCAELEGQVVALRAEAEAAAEAAAAAVAETERIRAAAGAVGQERGAEAEERQRLMELLEDREAACERLRSEMRSARADHQRLSDAVQSDRSCLSRALQQNRELKSQLEELQTGFVSAANRGAELTQQMQAEQHLAKELAARLGEQEDELRELRQDLAAREEELRALKLAYQSARETLLYRQPDSPGAGVTADAAVAASEAQQRLAQQLGSAQARVNQLTASNSELKALLYRSQQQQGPTQKPSASLDSAEAAAASADDAEDASGAGGGGGRSRNQSTATLQASVDQLESERNALLRAVDELRGAAAAGAAAGATVAHVSRAEFEEMQRARRQLEEKFHEAMDRVAKLQDDKERLEHTLMQLEVETETIGEYVTLYQYQRSQLHQRELEKEASISQLADERELMRLKLSELETLVRHLMSGSGQLLPQQQQQQQPLQQQHKLVPDGVHTSFSKPEHEQHGVVAANRILDIISQLHEDASSSAAVAGDPIRVMQCPCCHGNVIDL